MRIRLPNDPRLPEWWDAYRKAAGAPEARDHPKSFKSLISAYRDSPEFGELAEATRRGYERHLNIIEAKWGDLQVAGLLPVHVLKLRDKYRATPATANALIRTLSALLSWSVPRDYRTDNPCEHVRKLAIGEGWAPWPWEMILLLEQHAPPWMWEAAAIALYTGQRQADVLAMTRAKVRNGQIEVRQEKTGRELVIPAHQKLLVVLASLEERRKQAPGPHAVQILSNTRGLPWTQDGFRASWAGVLEPPQQKYGLLPQPHPLWAIKKAGLVFHGLRKSAVVTLLEAGCTDAEVAAITGQSRQMIEHYSRQVNQKKLAAAAILKWENAL
jgi:Phage integrase family